jgi:pimeloyl-ACP methyl ester carboxylesterase
LAAPWRGDSGQPAFYRQIAALTPEHTEPVAARLSQVRCPVMIGWGAQDPWIPVEQAARLRTSLPGNCPVVTLDEVGHLAPVEASSRVLAALSDWLAAPPARS